MPATAPSASNLYFAYGSNLDSIDFRQWLERHRITDDHYPLVSTACLPDHRIVFGRYSARREGGVLDVRPHRGSIVRGALYRPSGAAWAVLDEKEGLSSGAYARQAVEVILPDDRLQPAITYVLTEHERRDHVPPGEAYRAIVERGLESMGLPTLALHSAARGADGTDSVDALFVYGTLMQGECRHSSLARFEPTGLQPATVGGWLHATSADYPALRIGGYAGGVRVKGELMRLTDPHHALATLDAVEEFSGFGTGANLFVRSLAEVESADGKRRAWVYLAGERCPLTLPIESGDWRLHRISLESGKTRS